MSGKVHYHDHLDQGAHSVLGVDTHAASPLEELMEREEAKDDVFGAVSAAWLVEMFFEWVFADERPMDWRYAGRRGYALLREFCPGLLAARKLDEAGAFGGLTGGGSFAMDGLRDAAEGRDEEMRRIVSLFLRWIYQDDGRKWLERGTWRLYVLASRYHGRALKVWQTLEQRHESDPPGRWRDMGYADFAVAFGERGDDDEGARARWCYRAGKILEGIPQVPGAKTEEAREKMRRASKGNGNRRGKRKG
jgi:hypothetical protein